ncbi:GNAT family N-acetyltransferase [Clostridium sp. LIBA-8841]|uniref:GNAT family N-acetyltransferase n=1 Tax=Clostridium sp. LIBA-8841 TaxID=2987530 RepID=UPI002AC615A0|nr:GNAT family N-acetyltransferase [Clostridium sp. LIBA-8841]MDZ5254043.1 GNAT family N-acetyltransferase [Clostridium sp. LIBA-8841]
MKNVIYRDIKKEDLKEIEELIRDAFGFNNFIHNKELLDMITTLYLEETIAESSFIKVASKDDKVLGVILCNATKDSTNYNHLFIHLNQENFPTTLPIKNDKDKNETNEFLKIKDAYYELLKGKESLFDSSINLFIVSKEARGLGIGKTLLSYSLKYMNSVGTSSLYLFTDTRCNYGFYESQGFNRLEEKNVYIKTMESNIKTFLYSYSR